MANYSFTSNKPLPEVENGHTFEMCNFTQLEPHTKIFEGITGLTFIKCNLTNCDVPEDAELIGSQNIHFEWCSNAHPWLAERGFVNCEENCSHVIDSDTVTIDGITVDTIYHYKNKGVT